MDFSLSSDQLQRYRGLISVPGMSEAAQARLLRGCVLILGAAPNALQAARYLAEVGIGSLLLVDEDLRTLSAIRKELAESPRFSPDTNVSCFAWKFDAHSAEDPINKADVIIDGLVNWQDKLLASDVCMQLQRSFIHAGGAGFRFQIFCMRPSKSACLRCVFPQVGIDDFPLNADQSLTAPPIAALAGSMQALEAIKLIAQIGATQGNELLKFDGLSGEIEVLRGLDPRADCPDCGRFVR